MLKNAKLSRLELDVPSHTLKIAPITNKKEYDVYPATKTLMKKVLSKTTYDKWDAVTKLKKLNIKYDERLREYQKEGINKMLQLNGIAVFDQQRLGKTPMVLSALSHKEDLNSILIITPKSLMSSWEKETKLWFTNDVLIINGEIGVRRLRHKKVKKVKIISYNTLAKDINIVEQPDCIIIDEAHRLRNFKGMLSKKSPNMTKAIMKISYKTKYRVAITGTPSPNKSENIYPILHFLYPNIFTSYYKFIDYYYITEEKHINKYNTIKEIISFKEGKQQELLEFIDYISLQRKRIDYMKWLPKVDKKIVNTKLDKKESKWYNEIVKTFECKDLEISCPNTLTQMSALRHLTVVSQEKIDWINNYIEDYPDESIMIVSMFTSYLKKLKTKLNSSRLLIGEVSAEQRKVIEEQFNKKEFYILLCNIDVVKEGMKLEECNTIIFLDRSLTYTDNEQLEDRMLPTTVEKAVLKNKQQIIYLITKNSIDEYIDEMLKKKETATTIINNFKKYLNK